MPAEAASSAAADNPAPNAPPPAGPASAQLVHRTRERWRLRVPARRRDLPYFIRLYDTLRKQPEIREITVNPATASVLIWFAEQDAARLPEALTRDGLLELSASSSPVASRAESLQDAAGGRADGQASGRSPRHDRTAAPHPNAQHAFQMSVNDTRLLVFLIMLGLSLYQLSKKQFLAPALTMALYGIDLLAGLKQEREAANHLRQPPAP